MLAHVHRLLLDDLLLSSILLRTIRAEALLVATVTRVTPLLVKWLVCVSSAVFLLNDEVRRAAQVDLSHALCLLGLQFLLGELIGVLTDVVKELAPIEVLLGPPCDVVVGLLLLEAF